MFSFQMPIFSFAYFIYKIDYSKYVSSNHNHNIVLNKMKILFL